MQKLRFEPSSCTCGNAYVRSLRAVVARGTERRMRMANRAAHSPANAAAHHQLMIQDRVGDVAREAVLTTPLTHTLNSCTLCSFARDWTHHPSRQRTLTTPSPSVTFPDLCRAFAVAQEWAMVAEKYQSFASARIVADNREPG